MIIHTSVFAVSVDFARTQRQAVWSGLVVGMSDGDLINYSHFVINQASDGCFLVFYSLSNPMLCPCTLHVGSYFLIMHYFFCAYIRGKKLKPASCSHPAEQSSKSQRASCALKTVGPSLSLSLSRSLAECTSPVHSFVSSNCRL